jgi:hypothetical protein
MTVENLSTEEPQKFQKRIYYTDPKDGKTKTKIQTWYEGGEEDEWGIKPGPQFPPAKDGYEDIELKRKPGRPKGSKDKRGKRVARKTREPTRKI